MRFRFETATAYRFAACYVIKRITIGRGELTRGDATVKRGGVIPRFTLRRTITYLSNCSVHFHLDYANDRVTVDIARYEYRSDYNAHEMMHAPRYVYIYICTDILDLRRKCKVVSGVYPEIISYLTLRVSDTSSISAEKKPRKQSTHTLVRTFVLLSAKKRD